MAMGAGNRIRAPAGQTPDGAFRLKRCEKVLHW
jgi:hypothetical protein